MCDILDRREQLSKCGIEVFVLPGIKDKYYVEVYNKNVSNMAILSMYDVGENYNELLELTIQKAEACLKNKTI